LTNNNNFEIENTDSQIIYPLTEKNDQLSDSKKSDLQNIKMKNENDYKKEEENNIENEKIIY
jgi:virulence-associated protein VagC